MKTPLFQASAVCNFSNCISVTFSIMNEIASVGEDIIIVRFKRKRNIPSAQHKKGKLSVHVRLHLEKGKVYVQNYKIIQ